MTPDQIKESRAICEAARPGKWKGIITGFGGYLLLDVEGGPAVDLTDEDGLFIAHAHNILPRLLDDYEELKASWAGLLEQSARNYAKYEAELAIGEWKWERIQQLNKALEAYADQEEEFDKAADTIAELRKELRAIATCPNMMQAATKCTGHVHMPGGH